MKRSVVIVAATALLATSAVAADLPRKAPAYAPPPLPPPFSWTGFYGGIHAGWGFTSDSDATVTNNIAGVFDTIALSQNSNGVVGGIQVGYNWQFAPNWVVGIEGDFSGTGIQDTTVAALTLGGALGPAGSTHLAERDVKWLASIRGRLGYAADRWLFYVTGGGAWAGTDFTVGPNLPGTFGLATGSDTISGWTAGGGVEYAFTNNWTGRVEYLFYDLGDTNIANVGLVAPNIATTTWENQFHVVRLGVNYKF
jgi:outer membrane immunogenic protein